MDDRFKFSKPGGCAIDLGGAPGGWAQVAAERLGTKKDKGFVAAIDIQDMDPIAGVSLKWIFSTIIHRACS